MKELIDGVLQGKSRSMAKAISIIENNDINKSDLLSALLPHTGKGTLIGITGSPGAGKSSLTDRLIKFIRSQKLKVGVIAVDPSSPFSGGALLGDRIRMQEHVLDPNVYIRSMGTRGSLGGLARVTKEAVKVIDAAGYDVILIETVGVGQSELDIMNIADTTVVILNPGGGDYVQTIKAGIMEIADVFVVNKADLPGADKTASEVEAMLDLASREGKWRPLVVSTVATQDKGIDGLWKAIGDHIADQKEKGLFEQKRQQIQRQEVMDIVDFKLKEIIDQQLRDNKDIQAILKQVDQKELDPYSAANTIIKRGLKK